MNRLKNIDHAINILLSDTEADWAIPDTLPLKQRLMRALMNVRQPIKPSQELIDAQDKELVRQREEKGIVEIAEEGIQLWKGDYTNKRTRGTARFLLSFLSSDSRRAWIEEYCFLLYFNRSIPFSTEIGSGDSRKNHKEIFKETHKDYRIQRFYRY